MAKRRRPGSTKTGADPMNGTNRYSIRILLAGIAVSAVACAVGWWFSRNVRLGFAASGLAVVLAVLAVMWMVKVYRKNLQAREGVVTPNAEALLASAHPMIFSTTIEGVFTYVNHAAERTFAQRSTELVGKRQVQDFFAAGELDRVAQSLARLQPDLATSAIGISSFAFCIQSLLSLPPSKVRAVNFRISATTGKTIPATLYLSVLRNDAGDATGLLAVAVDQTHRVERQYALRESSERYRDLFDHAIDPIAVLDGDGRFIFANRQWKFCFGIDEVRFQKLPRIEELFDREVREQIEKLFERALNGETIDGNQVRTHRMDGRVLDLEISLSPRQKEKAIPTVRCTLRDVTVQKHRERRLALQLAVTQIVNQSASSQAAAIRILETLCLSLGWDVAILWQTLDAGERLQFQASWTSQEQQNEGYLQQAMISTQTAMLADEARRRNRAVWVEDFAAKDSRWNWHPALRFGLVSGWAVPIRVANHQSAVLELFSSQRIHEDQEMVAAVETILTTLGQMLARSREQDRADELHSRQRILLDTIADGICATDMEGTISLMNPAAARMLRVEAAEMMGTNLHELLHASKPGGEACGSDCALLAGMRQHKPTSAEAVVWRRDHSSFPAEFSLTPILENGRYSGAVISFRDVTQRFALDKLKDEFVSTVSHELRTPLTSIRGALGLLSSGILGQVNDKSANLLRIALSNSDRLVRLINDILDLERIQSGREPLSFRAVSFDEIVQQAIEGMQPVADAAGVQLIHDANAVQLKADPDRLLQVLTNLLSNAIKFSPAGATVSVTLRSGSNSVVLSVIDQGRGIPADKLDKIFDRFQQVDASDARQKGGSGLGLAICRTIVQQHGGNIWAERNAVCGSTFRVLLPYEPEPMETTESLPEEPLDFGTILIADAHARSRTALAAQLRRQGYRVLESATAQETLDALWEDAGATTPRELEAILLDASMSHLNGWEILPLLRQQGPAQQVPIVLLSTESPETSEELPDGAAGRIQKSGLEERLLSELARVLSVQGESARILVVEDDVDLARILADAFARSGIQVEQAHTRQDALLRCMSFRPQLIVLDLSLPDGDGFNVVDWLRQHDELAHLPLVVYSAREIPAHERSLLRLGPTQFLTKARVQPDQLESLVVTMLRRSRQRRESARLDAAIQHASAHSTSEE